MIPPSQNLISPTHNLLELFYRLKSKNVFCSESSEKKDLSNIISGNKNIRSFKSLLVCHT